jgi:plasmid stability protein
MSTLQIRAMPDDVKQILKTRAAAAGQSLSERAG